MCKLHSLRSNGNKKIKLFSSIKSTAMYRCLNCSYAPLLHFSSDSNVSAGSDSSCCFIPGMQERKPSAIFCSNHKIFVESLESSRANTIRADCLQGRSQYS